MKVSSRLFVSASLCPRSNHKLLQVSSKAAMKADGPPQASTPVSWDPQVIQSMKVATVPLSSFPVPTVTVHGASLYIAAVDDSVLNSPG
jgi:hypothetical protein